MLRHVITGIEALLIPTTAVVIDDEELMRRVVKVALEAIGCEFAGEAEDGDEGLKLIEDVRPDLVLLDIKMPVLSGLDVLRQLRQIDSPAHVIVLTGIDDDGLVEESMILGAKDYLKKNMPVQDMVERLTRQVERIQANN